MNCCGNNWRCLDLLNWRLCDYKCVSNTIWLKMNLFLKCELILKYELILKCELILKPVEVVGHCKSFQLLELAV